VKRKHEAARVYWSQLHFVASNILDSYHLAEDAVQDGLLSAYQNLKRAREEHIQSYRWRLKRMHLRSWLYTIVRNKAKDRISDLRGEPMEDGNEYIYVDGERIWESHNDILERMAREERAVYARLLITTLPSMQASVLMQKFFRDDGFDSEDVTNQQIANELGIPLNTVKSHMHRGLERLRELLLSEEMSP